MFRKPVYCQEFSGEPRGCEHRGIGAVSSDSEDLIGTTLDLFASMVAVHRLMSENIGDLAADPANTMQVGKSSRRAEGGSLL